MDMYGYIMYVIGLSQGYYCINKQMLKIHPVNPVVPPIPTLTVTSYPHLPKMVCYIYI